MGLCQLRWGRFVTCLDVCACEGNAEGSVGSVLGASWDQRSPGDFHSLDHCPPWWRLRRWTWDVHILCLSSCPRRRCPHGWLKKKRRSDARGVNHLNLRSLHDGNPVKSLVQSSLSSSVTTPVAMALINARSLANKTFILNDLFASHKLDFVFITETWLKAGDMSSLSELSSTGGCSFFSTPGSIGQGGGLAVLFKEKFKCLNDFYLRTLFVRLNLS